MQTLEQKFRQCVFNMRSADLRDDDRAFWDAREELDYLRESDEYKEKYGDELYPAFMCDVEP